MSKKLKSAEDSCYVMYGYKKSDIDTTGYLHTIASDCPTKCFLTDDIKQAKRFYSAKDKKTGTPEQWLKFINEEMEDMFGDDAFVFHLVKTSFKKD